MNRDEARTILLLYRPGTADANDPRIAEALAAAQGDPELSRWLEEHCARQEALRAKFRQIAAPAGLKEQIVSEQAASSRLNSRRRLIIGAAAVAAIVGSLVILTPFWLPPRAVPGNTLAIFENQMTRAALSGYYMNLMTNDPAQIQNYLAQNRAPADYVLPPALQKTAMAGCAIEGWQSTRASMICFRTGRPLPAGRQADLWLFVADRASLKDAPPPGPPRITTVQQLATAVWTRNDKVYFLFLEGNEQTLQPFL